MKLLLPGMLLGVVIAMINTNVKILQNIIVNVDTNIETGTAVDISIVRNFAMETDVKDSVPMDTSDDYFAKSHLIIHKRKNIFVNDEEQSSCQNYKSLASSF